ncbi:MAG: helix-hairpin-helix domain-containing protein [Gorillibacterium sp.]|nr:helix-hairpin-helix domain-containing protein [Gorillibacterium sp.]
MPKATEIPKASEIPKSTENPKTTEANHAPPSAVDPKATEEQTTSTRTLTQTDTRKPGFVASGVVTGLIDLNTASLAQLMELPRIGETKAAAIIAYREQHGGFGSPEEIVNVKGIGEKTYESFKDQITVTR